MPEFFSLNSSPVFQDNYMNFRLSQHRVEYLTVHEFQAWIHFLRDSGEVVLGCYIGYRNGYIRVKY